MNIHFTHTQKLFNKINVFSNGGTGVRPSEGLRMPGFRDCRSHSLMPSSCPTHGGGK